MTVLHHLAQAAAVILLVELLVALALFLGVAGGLAFGLHWVRGKSDWAFGKANEYLPLAVRYTHSASDAVAKPFVTGAGWLERVKVTAEAVRRQVPQRAKTRSGARAGSGVVAPDPGVAPVAASGVARPVDLDSTVPVTAVSEAPPRV